MSDDQFTKLFKYMQSEFAVLKEELSNKASQDSLDRLTNTIDEFVKMLDDSEVNKYSVMLNLLGC